MSKDNLWLAEENFLNIELGRKGEKMAQKYLKKQKYKILETNFNTKLGEIDIICLDKKEKQIVFVEVKAKTSDYFGLPREMVDEQKQHKIERVATLYLMQTHQTDVNFRFDVVEILGGSLEHIKNAW